MGRIHKYKGKNVESWVAHYTDSYGKRQRLVIGHCDSISFEEAQLILLEKEKEKYLKRAGLPVLKKMKTREFFQRFKSYKSRRVSKKSLKVYQSRINFWKKIHLKKSRVFHPLSFDEIEEAVDSLDRTFGTLNSYISMLKQIYKYALKENLMLQDPAKDYEFFPKIPKKKPRYFTKAEMNRILEISSPFYKDLFNFFLNTGLRRDEVRLLKWDNVDLYNRVVKIKDPKEKKDKTIPLNSIALEILERRPRDFQYVFSNPGGKPYGVVTWLNYLHRRMKELGIFKGGIHTLRHTFASRLAAKRVPILQIQKLLGHSNITTTQIYAHLDSEDLRSAVQELEDI